MSRMKPRNILIGLAGWALYLAYYFGALSIAQHYVNVTPYEFFGIYILGMIGWMVMDVIGDVDRRLTHEPPDSE